MLQSCMKLMGRLFCKANTDPIFILFYFCALLGTFQLWAEIHVEFYWMEKVGLIFWIEKKIQQQWHNLHFISRRLFVIRIKIGVCVCMCVSYTDDNALVGTTTVSRKIYTVSSISVPCRMGSVSCVCVCVCNDDKQVAAVV